MKKVLKSRIFIVIITLIIGISGTLYAGAKYQASEILFNPSSGDNMTVNEALNELYENFYSKNSGSTKIYSFNSPKGEYSYSFNLRSQISSLNLDYTKLTKDDFYVVPNCYIWLRWSGSQDQTNFTPSSKGFSFSKGVISYDASTGTLKAGLYLYYQPYAGSYGNMDFGFDVYVMS